jgi:hypothetical protein
VKALVSLATSNGSLADSQCEFVFHLSECLRYYNGDKGIALHSGLYGRSLCTYIKHALYLEIPFPVAARSKA